MLYKHLGIDVRTINCPLTTTQVRNEKGHVMGVLNLRENMQKWDPSWPEFTGTVFRDEFLNLLAKDIPQGEYRFLHVKVIDTVTLANSDGLSLIQFLNFCVFNNGRCTSFRKGFGNFL